MSILKRLISDTAIYGTSSILARMLNYLLTFFIATLIATKDFGVFTDLYAMVAFLLVILTHGMETAFFRHINILDERKNVFGTAFLSVATFASFFLLLSVLFIKPIAIGLKYPDQQNYILIFAFIVFFDVLTAVPFANLRHLGKAKKFAIIKIFNVLLTIGLNIFFLWLCPKMIDGHSTFSNWISSWYQQDSKVMYVFVANLMASGVNLLLMLPEISKISFKIDKEVYKKMLYYGLPIMLLGFAGTINEMFDRKILRFYLPYDDAENLRQLGIYGFAYKISMIMAMFLQAYKFAVEPILFSEATNKNAPSTYAKIMKYYLVTVCILFVFMIFNLPLIEHLLYKISPLSEDYRAAFKLVPILLAANAFLGIYFNVATWYKVSDKTMYGAYIAFFGAAITIALNLIFVPMFEIQASAWTTLICYLAMTGVGLWLGQKFYPIPYQFKRLSLYLFIALIGFGIYFVSQQLPFYYLSLISILLVASFITIVYKLEKGDLKK